MIEFSISLNKNSKCGESSSLSSSSASLILLQRDRFTPWVYWWILCWGYESVVCVQVQGYWLAQPEAPPVPRSRPEIKRQHISRPSIFFISTKFLEDKIEFQWYFQDQGERAKTGKNIMYENCTLLHTHTHPHTIRLHPLQTQDKRSYIFWCWLFTIITADAVF